ncbi:putative protein phosphatase 2C family [Helianthus annuus]|nr:putative protein phosphatase 2C family [Helianthus annuus]
MVYLLIVLTYCYLFFQAVSCSVNIKSNTVVESTARSFCPTSIRSGGHTDIGPRRSNEDQHIMIDDLSKHLGDAYSWVSQVHSTLYLTVIMGPRQHSYVKEHAMRLFLRIRIYHKQHQLALQMQMICS